MADSRVIGVIAQKCDIHQIAGSFRPLPDHSLQHHFCPECGCVAYWRARKPGDDGRTRIAVNLRLTEPGPVAQIPIDHFDGLDRFEDLPRDGRCVGDYWF